MSFEETVERERERERERRERERESTHVQIGEDGLRRMQSRRGRGNALLKASSQQTQQKGSGAALSDLYNKFTGGWFGGN